MELTQVFKARWDGLQTREQQILRFSAVILALLLLYLWVIDPVYSGRDDAEQRLRSSIFSLLFVDAKVSSKVCIAILRSACR